MREPLLIGTNNQGKVGELTELLRGLPWDVKSLADFPSVPEPVENDDTFEANAVKKAGYFNKCFDVCCVADDSGLVVDALDGAPGVFSARYAGPDCNDADNRAKLLAALDDVPEPGRTARFVCCAAMVDREERAHVEMGTVEGRIALECRGRRGFGYDPLFIPDGFEQTFGEVDPSVKMSISHRARAFGKLRAFLEVMR